MPSNRCSWKLNWGTPWRHCWWESARWNSSQKRPSKCFRQCPALRKRRSWRTSGLWDLQLIKIQGWQRQCHWQSSGELTYSQAMPTTLHPNPHRPRRIGLGFLWAFSTNHCFSLNRDWSMSLLHYNPEVTLMPMLKTGTKSAMNSFFKCVVPKTLSGNLAASEKV